jgi:hypothetical protein
VVGVWRFTRPLADLLESACDVAVTVTVDGSPEASVGAVYTPLASIEPPPEGETDQLTAVFEALLTLAVNVCVCAGQPSAASFGNRFTAVLGLTVKLTGGLLPPHAISNPSNASETHSPAAAEYLDTLRPANPASTMPAIGSVTGSHGKRLSARRCKAAPAPVFGPLVVMVSETGIPVAPAVPAAMDGGLKTQLAVVSGKPVQAKVTATPKVEVPNGVAVKL